MKKNDDILAISATRFLPLAMTIGTEAILGQKGGGKSYKASVIVEELLKANQQVVVLDPTSAWWGLRSSADGKSAGYPITIFGGEHGDLPIQPDAGAELARAVVHERFSAIFDLDGLTKGEEQRFSAAFLETLYRSKVGEYRTPLKLVLDEADVYAPQKPFGPEAVTLGACQSIVRRGRIKGIGCMMITQRAAVLNKDVLSQVDTLITLRMSHKLDLNALEAWVGVHGDPQKAKAMIATMPDLARGDAWVWSPMNHIFDRVTFRDRVTFDSGKTPEVGEVVAPPKVLAAVDVARLSSAVMAAIADVRANDPKVLKTRIAELEAQVAQAPLAGSRVAIAEASAEGWKALHDRFRAAVEAVADDRDRTITAVLDMLTNQQMRDRESRRDANKIMVATSPPVITGIRDGGRGHVTKMFPVEKTMKAWVDGGNAPKPIEVGDAGPMTRDRILGEIDNGKSSYQRILDAIAWFERLGITAPAIEAVAFRAGYSPQSGTHGVDRGRLRSVGLVEYRLPGTVSLTDAGRSRSASEQHVVPSRLREDVITQLAAMRKDGKALAAIMQHALEAYPKALTIARLSQLTGFSVSSGSFGVNRGKLRAMSLIEYPAAGSVRATDFLFPERR